MDLPSQIINKIGRPIKLKIYLIPHFHLKRVYHFLHICQIIYLNIYIWYTVEIYQYLKRKEMIHDAKKGCFSL